MVKKILIIGRGSISSKHILALKLISKKFEITNLSSRKFNNNYAKQKFFDVIFIDGLHSYEQCSKDCINSMKFLNTGGLIILHDMLPRSKTEETQKFSGDAWKVGWDLVKSKNINFIISNIDQGVGLVKITDSSIYIKQDEIKNKNFSDYKDFYYKKLPIRNIEDSLNFIKLD